MAASEDEPVLNIFIPTLSSRQPKQVKLTAREKIPTKKAASVQRNSVVLSKDYAKTEDVKENRRTERRENNNNKDNNNSTYLHNFSSLFTSNPDIPKVKSLAVEKLTESVFSGKSFRDLDIHPFMVSNLEEKMGFKEMTSVQQAVIPALLRGHDALVKSQTGSGKTLSYAIPLVQHLQSKSPHTQRSDGPYALVIVPTRELALQSLATIQKLVGPFSWLVPGCIMGGEKKKSEKARLRKGINILLATPGRLLDHIETTSCLQLTRVQWLVIDEADRLLELGFEKTIAKVITALDAKSSQRQTVLLSATLSAGVERLAGISLRDPVRVDLSHDGGKMATDEDSKMAATDDSKMADEVAEQEFATPDGLKHQFVVVPHKLRLVTLAAFLLSKTKFCSQKNKVLVFFSTQASVEFHHELLQSALFDEEADDLHGAMTADILLFKLHGDMLQKDRTKTYTDFCSADSGVLLCTDVAARGLDIAHVRHIVQYNAPACAADYVHRAGRTARATRTGHALLFLAPTEVDYLATLTACKIQMEEVTMSGLLKQLMSPADKPDKTRRHGRATRQTTEQNATSLQRRFELLVQQDKSLRTLARKAFQAYVRSYAAYPKSLKSVFRVAHLHLGHVAKSFGLQDTPSVIGEIAGRFSKLDANRARGKASPSHKPDGKRRVRADMMSEFSSGLTTPAGRGEKRKAAASKNLSASKKRRKGHAR